MDFAPFNISVKYYADKTPSSVNDFPSAIESPFDNTWMIPNNFNIKSLPLRTSDAQLESLVLAVWHEYMLHDEILSAINYLENAPYRVRHNLKIQQALNITKASISWMDDPIRAEFTNTATDPNGLPTFTQCGSPFPGPMSDGQHKNRFDWVCSRIKRGTKRMLDLGCQDGTMTNRYSELVEKVIGVDMNINNLRIANDVASYHGLDAEYVNSYFSDLKNHLPVHSFDMISCTDVYEHLKNPVDDLLIPAKLMASSSATMVLITPNGAWLRGDYLPWAHPWLWYEKHGSWICDENRAHLVAPTIKTVVDDFKKSGWWVKNAIILNHEIKDTDGQSSICVEAISNQPPGHPRLKMIINDKNNDHRLLKFAKKFSLCGNEVFLYRKVDGFSVDEHVIIDNISFLDSDHECDILISDDYYPEIKYKLCNINVDEAVDKDPYSVIKKYMGL